MPESISQWSAEYLPSVLLSLALWSLAAAAIGFLAGVILFFFLRLIRLYRMKFQLGGLVTFLLFLYTVFVATMAFGFIGFFESLKRQADDVLESEENRQMIGELSGALSSRSAALAYAYGIQAQENPNAQPELQKVVAQMDSFDKGKWGIDLAKSDQAFDQITDEIIQQNYEKLYQVVFKDVGGNEEDSRQKIKSVLDRFVDPNELTADLLINPLRSTLADLKVKRQTSGKTGPVYAEELKAHAGEESSVFLGEKLGAMILTQQVFIAIIGSIALLIPVVLVVVIKILVKVTSKNPPSQQTS